MTNLINIIHQSLFLLQMGCCNLMKFPVLSTSLYSFYPVEMILMET